MQKLFTFLVIIGASFFFYYLYAEQQGLPLIPGLGAPTMPTVRIATVPIRVEVADTAAERERGLSGRDWLESTDGMLFIFDETDYHTIWMKDMRFAIDVIWINADLVVVDITRDLRPDTYPRLFEPRVPAQFSIEVNANHAEAFGIRVGDEVTVPAGVIPKNLRN